MFTEVLKGLQEYLQIENSDLKIIRKNQSGNKPAYPFCGFSFLSNNREKFVFKKNIPNSDPTKISEKYFGFNELVLSLSFYDVAKNEANHKPMENCYELAESALSYFQFEAKELLEEHNFVLDLSQTTIEDRTTYLDPVYECQVGFEIKIKTVRTKSVIVDTIDLDETFKGIELEVTT